MGQNKSWIAVSLGGGGMEAGLLAMKLRSACQWYPSHMLRHGPQVCGEAPTSPCRAPLWNFLLARHQLTLVSRRGPALQTIETLLCHCLECRDEGGLIPCMLPKRRV